LSRIPQIARIAVVGRVCASRRPGRWERCSTPTEIRSFALFRKPDFCGYGFAAPTTVPSLADPPDDPPEKKGLRSVSLKKPL
jgi:hypothetical protein